VESTNDSAKMSALPHVVLGNTGYCFLERESVYSGRQVSMFLRNRCFLLLGTQWWQLVPLNKGRLTSVKNITSYMFRPSRSHLQADI
jgi:hypothetical protein